MRLFRAGKNNNNNRQPSNHQHRSAHDKEPVVVSADDFARQSADLIPAEVRMISGCHSEQTSADVLNVRSVAQLPNPAGRSGGACTSALLEILYHHHHPRHSSECDNGNGSTSTTAICGKSLSFQQVLLDLRDTLSKRGFDQIPQLTSSRPLDLQDTFFSLSGNKNGVQRALLVGINYIGQKGQLGGCHNDVWNVKKYLIEVQNFQEQHILVLVDDGRNRHFPTRKNIIASLRQLVAQSIEGDSVYFHYSGHGGLLNPEWNIFKSNNKDYDETVYPSDHERSGQIRDFSLFNNFVKPMPAGVFVTCVMDCCAHGAVLELPYSFKPTSAGTIQMQRNFSSLSNLTFLYLLAGGGLPMGFDHVQENIEQVTGGNIEDYLGAGIEDMEMDDTDFGAYDTATAGAYGDEAATGVDNFDGDVGPDGEFTSNPDDLAGSGGDMDDLGIGDAPQFVQAVDVNPVDDVTRGWGGDLGYGDGNATGPEDWGGGDPLGSGGFVQAADVAPVDVGRGWDGGDGDYGGFAGGGRDDMGDVDPSMFGDGDGGDVDCSCLGDVLGALMDNQD